jgi:putative transposase
MFRTFEAVLAPTIGQQVKLARLFRFQCELYNAALEERRGVWAQNSVSVSRFEQFKSLSGFEHPVMDFGTVPARGTLTRLDRAFQSFFRRVKAGEKAGFPRFKPSARWASVEYPDRSCWKITAGDRKHDGVGRLYLQGVGQVRFRGAKRGIRGAPKTLIVRRVAGKYRMYVAYVLEPTYGPRKPQTPQNIGVDLGVTEVVALSDGTTFENPRELKQSAIKLAKLQQDLARKQKGSNRRKRAVERVACQHRKIAMQRRNRNHQIASEIVKIADGGLIVFENLQISNMVSRVKPRPDPNNPGEFLANGQAAKTGLNREIHAAGWTQLRGFTGYKAEEADSLIDLVDPRFTSQTCNACGHIAPENRDGTRFVCIKCGHKAHADVNAGQNILGRADPTLLTA